MTSTAVAGVKFLSESKYNAGSQPGTLYQSADLITITLVPGIRLPFFIKWPIDR